ncbi:MAG: hypothetical protein JKY51_06840 [Opitutaceae bacterium]|nr:hypothetical protein [Opitutaceae bacterium]
MKKILMIVIGLFLMSTSLAAVAEKMHKHKNQVNTKSEQVEETKAVTHDHRKQKGLHPSTVKKTDLNNGSADVVKKTKRHDFAKEHK